jgi:hypothetical protein
MLNVVGNFTEIFKIAASHLRRKDVHIGPNKTLIPLTFAPLITTFPVFDSNNLSNIAAARIQAGYITVFL